MTPTHELLTRAREEVAEARAGIELAIAACEMGRNPHEGIRLCANRLRRADRHILDAWNTHADTLAGQKGPSPRLAGGQDGRQGKQPVTGPDSGPGA